MNRNAMTLLTGILMVALVAASAAADEVFGKLGSWSNVRVSESEDPHATGYRLDLWTHGEKTVGVLSAYVGPVADPPIGELENIVFNRETGDLGFEVRMSLGMTASGSGEPDDDGWISSRDAYGFLGRLEDGKITGDLIHVPMNAEPPTPDAQTITLEALPPGEGSGLDDSYEAWRAWLDEALENRGPKW